MIITQISKYHPNIFNEYIWSISSTSLRSLHRSLLPTIIQLFMLLSSSIAEHVIVGQVLFISHFLLIGVFTSIEVMLNGLDELLKGIQMLSFIFQPWLTIVAKIWWISSTLWIYVVVGVSIFIFVVGWCWWLITWFSRISWYQSLTFLFLTFFHRSLPWPTFSTLTTSSQPIVNYTFIKLLLRLSICLISLNN